MDWVHFSIVCMVLTVAKTFVAKSLLRRLQPLNFVIFDLGLSLIFVCLFWQKFDFAAIDYHYLIILAVICLPSIAGLNFLSTATKQGEVSEVAPLLILIPALSALVAPFVTGEVISGLGLAGIFVVLFGGYLLKLENFRNPLGPFKALQHDRALKFVLLTVGVSVVNVNLQKLLVLKSDPLTLFFLQQLIMTGLAAPILAWHSRARQDFVASFKANWPLLLLLGVITTTSCLSNLLAYHTGGQVAYVLSIKRLSVVFIAIIGMLALKESYRSAKALGIGFMVGGCLILAHAT